MHLWLFCGKKKWKYRVREERKIYGILTILFHIYFIPFHVFVRTEKRNNKSQKQKYFVTKKECAQACVWESEWFIGKFSKVLQSIFYYNWVSRFSAEILCQFGVIWGLIWRKVTKNEFFWKYFVKIFVSQSRIFCLRQWHTPGKI